MSEPTPAAGAPPTLSHAAAAPKRSRLPLVLGLAAIGAVLVGVGLWARARSGVSTDDAFLRTDLVHVPAEVGGRVVEVQVKEGQHVAAGDLLVRIDDTDYRLHVAQAQANLAAAEADARRAEEGAVATRSDIAMGKVRLSDAERERKLQEVLAAGGASVQAAVDRARAASAMAAQGIRTAQAGLDASQAAVAAAQARVPAAQAAVDLALRELEHCEVRAPHAGVASRVELQPGELLERGAPVLAIVPDERYVVANFKETDLERIHVGDPVKIEIDAYPQRPLAGTVESIGAGTGAVFSLLPADNASGNFIKVVQRVPIRIALRGEPPSDMAAGLSANVTVGGTVGGATVAGSAE